MGGESAELYKIKSFESFYPIWVPTGSQLGRGEVSNHTFPPTPQPHTGQCTARRSGNIPASSLECFFTLSRERGREREHSFTSWFLMPTPNSLQPEQRQQTQGVTLPTGAKCTSQPQPLFWGSQGMGWLFHRHHKVTPSSSPCLE